MVNKYDIYSHNFEGILSVGFEKRKVNDVYEYVYSDGPQNRKLINPHCWRLFCDYFRFFCGIFGSFLHFFKMLQYVFMKF